MLKRSWLVWTVVAALSLLTGVELVRVAVIAGMKVPLDSNEGWNAYHSVAALSGRALYPQAPSLLFNNYPPLSFYIVGVFGRLIGDAVIAGRILSLMACLTIGGLIAAILRAMRTAWAEALFSAVCFVAGVLIFSGYVGMDDPQLLGQAVGTCGYLLLLRSPSWQTVVVASLLLTLACFIKHNLVAQPIALVCWFAIYARRRAIWLSVSGVLFALLGYAAFRITYGIDLMSQLASARSYNVGQLATAVETWLPWGGAPAIALVVLVLWHRHDRDIILCGLYALFAILLGVFFSGGAGVDVNAWFDAAIALALGTGLVLNRLGNSLRSQAAILLVYIIPLICGVAINETADWLAPAFWLHPMHAESMMAQQDIAFLRARRGPALCEMLSLCYWAGKEPEVDVFNLGQAYARHARDDAFLAAQFRTKRYAAIQFDSVSDFAFSERVRRALLASYRPDHENDEGVFFVRR